MMWTDFEEMAHSKIDTKGRIYPIYNRQFKATVLDDDVAR